MYISIQYLRAISALAVVFFHIYHTTGQQGVAIFFVISGFLMMDIMEKRCGQSNLLTAFSFFKARFVRIAPLYYILTALTLSLGLAYDPTYLRLIQSLTFTALGSVLPVGYTLTYEFLFYSLCSISILLIGSHVYRAFIIIVILIVGDYILNLLLLSRNFEYGNYFWLFVAGILSHFIYKKYDCVVSAKIANIFILVIFVSFLYLFGGAYLNFSWYVDDVNHYAINNAVPSFLIVLFSLFLERFYQGEKINYYKFLYLPHKAFLYIGSASYSIYLTHYLTLHGADEFLNVKLSNEVLLFSSIFVGCITYKYLEIPVSKLINKYSRGNKSLKITN